MPSPPSTAASCASGHCACEAAACGRRVSTSEGKAASRALVPVTLPGWRTRQAGSAARWPSTPRSTPPAPRAPQLASQGSCSSRQRTLSAPRREATGASDAPGREGDVQRERQRKEGPHGDGDGHERHVAGERGYSGALQNAPEPSDRRSGLRGDEGGHESRPEGAAEARARRAASLGRCARVRSKPRRERAREHAPCRHGRDTRREAAGRARGGGRQPR